MGRDPAGITKTVLFTVEDPGAAADQVAAFVGVGVDGVVVNLRGVEDLDKVARTGEALRKVLA